MTNYTIKQRFDSLSTPIAVFNEKYDDIVIKDCDIVGVAVKIIKDL